MWSLGSHKTRLATVLFREIYHWTFPSVIDNTMRILSWSTLTLLVPLRKLVSMIPSANVRSQRTKSQTEGKTRVGEWEVPTATNLQKKKYHNAVFKWLTKEITRLRLLRLLIGWKDSRQFSDQWEAKAKPMELCTTDFSSALTKLQVIARNSHWFIGLVVISRSNYFLVLVFR